MSQRFPEDPAARRAREARLKAHRGLATWGEKLVPLGEFRQAAVNFGRELDRGGQAQAKATFLAGEPALAVLDPTPVEGPFTKVALFGGIYNNSYGLEALLDEVTAAQVQAIYCLGDFGGFGPHPEKVWPLLEQGNVLSIMGNYEESLASGRQDCNCGYADPRDNHFALLSYSYTEQNCSAAFKAWMGTHPRRRRLKIGGRELLLVHGSPRRINEFLFSSTSPDAFLEILLDQERCDVLLCTHSGLPWHRRLPSGREVINVGVIGRPANDGHQHVWYCLLEDRDGRLEVDLRPLVYDFQSLAADMRQEKLPEEFIETVTSGWWTTCLEILPARERAASRF